MPKQQFHNPYQFVPVYKVSQEDLTTTWLAKDKLHNSRRHSSHDRYHQHTFSGRIVCKLTTIAPIFIGAERCREGNEDDHAEIAPFELNCRPAIPAASLMPVAMKFRNMVMINTQRILRTSRSSVA